MPVASVSDLVRELWPARSRLLDIGCGRGDLVRSLTGMGHKAFGCDPQAARIAEAESLGPSGVFTIASAESLPYADQEFDGALMVHSFHHVPETEMNEAISEALRCIQRGGYIAVVEPIAEGSFFEILRIVDDETAVRTAAQQALSKAVASGFVRPHARHSWGHMQVYSSIDDVISQIVANDPSRAEWARLRLSDLETCLTAVGRPLDRAWQLEHFTQVDVLTAS